MAGRLVPAVVRALDILELFLDGRELSVPDITGRLGLPRTTVHELVNTLVARKYLTAVADGVGRYRLGLPLFQLGSVFAEHLDLAREARAVSEEVAGRCDETVHVAVLDGTDVVYIAKADSTYPVRLVSAVGRRVAAHCTAVGKMLLSDLDDAVLADRYPNGTPLARLTPKSITSPTKLRQHLADVREQGFAQESGESNDGVVCVAGPVRDAGGGMVAAMSISVPSPRWTDESAADLRALGLKGAGEVSARLGPRLSR